MKTKPLIFFTINSFFLGILKKEVSYRLYTDQSDPIEFVGPTFNFFKLKNVEKKTIFSSSMNIGTPANTRVRT